MTYGDAARAAVERLEAAATQAEQAANLGAVDSVWAWIIGAESAAAAARASATATRNLAIVMRSKLGAVVARNDPAEVRTFIEDCGRYADVSDVLAAVDLLTPEAAIVQTAQGVARDLKPYLAIGLPVLAVVVVLALVAKAKR